MQPAIINNKGGVGKTTTAVNLAAAWARARRSTLLVDLDSQCSASLHLGARQPERSVEDLLRGREDVVPVTPTYLAVEGLVQFLASTEEDPGHSGQLGPHAGNPVDHGRHPRPPAGEVTRLLRGQYGPLVLESEVRVNVRLAEASSHGCSIFEYEPRCPGARAYSQVWQEVEARCPVPALVG